MAPAGAWDVAADPNAVVTAEIVGATKREPTCWTLLAASCADKLANV